MPARVKRNAGPVRTLRLPGAALAAAAAHGLRMAVNLVIIKLVAIFLGPAGLGAIGNLLSVISIVMVFAGGGIANGITKYVAEHTGRPRATLRLIETAYALGFSASGLVMAISLLAAVPIAAALFGDKDLWWLSPLLGVAHFGCFLGTATIAVANGRQRPDVFAAISITAYLGCIPAAFLLIWLLRFPGAALALMLMASCTGLPAAWLVLRDPLRRLARPRFHRAEAGQLVRFGAMTLVSAFAFPVAEIIVRSAVTHRLGLDQAGLWQASIRLSGAILGFYTVYLATSYMPRLSATRDPAAAFRLIVTALVRTGAIFIAGALAIYALRSAVVPLLFSNAFAPLEPLLGWQLLGDLFRVCAYVIAFFAIARARLRLHIAAEFVQYALYATICWLVIANGGQLADVIRAYTLSYAIYFALAAAALLIHRRTL